jgi:hypothetical protein
MSSADALLCAQKITLADPMKIGYYYLIRNSVKRERLIQGQRSRSPGQVEYFILTMHNIIVIGGGISGLSLVYKLRQVIPSCVKIQLFESSYRVGGMVKTDRHSSFLFEVGPRGFRPSRNGAEMVHLVEQLGLKDQCIASVGNERFIFTNKKIEVTS